MSALGRRLASKAREVSSDTAVQPELSATVLAGMDRRAAEASAARLAELERINAGLHDKNAKAASDYTALTDALHARSPKEWHAGDPATAALSYLHYLEDAADRCGIDRRPPWAQPPAAGDERGFRGLVAEFGAEELFGLPVPERTAPETGEDAGKPGTGRCAGTIAPTGPVYDEDACTKCLGITTDWRVPATGDDGLCDACREDTQDAGPGIPPPAGEDEAAAPSSPLVPGPAEDTGSAATPAGEDRDPTSSVPAEPVPAEDEGTEHDGCAEGAETA